MRRGLWLTVFLMAFSLPATAQHTLKARVVGGSSYAVETPKVEIFGGYSYARANGINLNGWNAALAANADEWLGLAADFSGHFASADRRRHSFLFGPRISYRAHYRLVPFVHSFFGVVRITPAPAGYSDTTFGAAFGFGVDLRVRKRVAIRLFQVEDVITRFREFNPLGGACILASIYPPPEACLKKATQHTARLSAGIVFRLGRKQ